MTRYYCQSCNRSKLKRFTEIFLCFVLAFCLTACGNQFTGGETSSDEGSRTDNTEGQTSEIAPTAGQGNDNTAETESPVVYMTTDISSDAMMKIYAALGKEVAGNKIAVKLSTGEPPASNYLKPELIKELVQHYLCERDEPSVD